MKVTDSDITREVVTLTEAIKRLADARKKDIYVEVERVGKEGYIIPMAFMPMVVGSQDQGKVYPNPPGSKNISMMDMDTIHVNGVGAAPDALVAMGDEAYRIHQILCWMVCSVAVANRVNGLELDVVGPDGFVGGRFVTSTTITLTAGQLGGHFFGYNNIHWNNTNNVVANVANENPLPIEVEQGSGIVFNSTNIDAADVMDIVIWYENITKP